MQPISACIQTCKQGGSYILEPDQLESAYKKLQETRTFPQITTVRTTFEYEIVVKPITTVPDLQTYVDPTKSCLSDHIKRQTPEKIQRYLDDKGGMYIGFHEIAEEGKIGYIRLYAATDLEQGTTILFEDVICDNTMLHWHQSNKVVLALYLQQVAKQHKTYIQTPGSATKPAEQKRIKKIGSVHLAALEDAFYQGKVRINGSPQRTFLDTAHLI